jgi:hypothetical protein
MRLRRVWQFSHTDLATLRAMPAHVIALGVMPPVANGV